MGFSLRDHALTTRGYALLQVNYVGSTGYGRQYRDRLKGAWGLSDVADTASAVEYLAQQGLIDRSRVGITGHSAGGYATLQALAKYPAVWACGVAESGISDMMLLIEETHSKSPGSTRNRALSGLIIHSAFQSWYLLMDILRV